MSTARDLINSALRKIGALSQGETPPAADSNEALLELNKMLETWSNQSLMIHTKVRETFTLVVGTASYTVGSGATFDTTRPIKIENAGVILVNGSDATEVPMDIITKDEYAEIADKAVQSSIPTRLYPAGTYPNETVTLWPVPSQANTLALYSWKPLSSLSSINTSVSLPPGYEDAIIYNLAVRLAPDYGKEASPTVMQTANESKAYIKRINFRPQYLKSEAAGIVNAKPFSILTGGYD